MSSERAAHSGVTELGYAFLCAELDFTPETREDHASYIGNWLQVLKNDFHGREERT